jgi:Methyltransferase domain
MLNLSLYTRLMEMRKLSIEALPRPLKKLAKCVIPDTLIEKRRNRILNSFSGRSNREIFSSTYRNYLWGRNQGDFNFYSGDGSHKPEIIDEYIREVSSFIAKFASPPVVVDLGCGDFHIGSQLCKYAEHYFACDVVPEIIEANMSRNDISNVSFRVLDAASQELPKGDIVILRQVLQHLSNSDVQNVLQRIQGNFQYLVFTDHQPLDLEWIPNLDKQTGPNIRTEFGSGLDLNQAPFNLNSIDCKLISNIKVEDGYIRTFIFQLD